MSGILVVADHHDGTLRDVTLEAVSAAEELRRGTGGEISVAVLGADPTAQAGPLALEGIDEIVAVPVGSDAFNAETYRSAIAALIAERRPSVVLAGFTVSAL